MDPNRLLTKIRSDLGLDGLLKDIVKDEEIMERVDLKTRDTFSRFFKHVFIIENIVFDKYNRSMHDENKYKLPDKAIRTLTKLDISISGIKEIRRKDRGDGTKLVGDGLVYFPHRHTRGGAFVGNHHARAGYNQARNDLLKYPKNYEFMEPYFIRFRQKYHETEKRKYIVEFFSDHPKNLSTIKDSYAETFEELAKLDIKQYLWENKVSYLNNLDLGQTQIDLKKEKWSNAKNERDDMVSNFRNAFIADYPTTVVI